MSFLTKKLWLALLLLAVLRIAGLDLFLFGDETLFAMNAADQKWAHYYIDHPPLMIWTLNVVSAVFGTAPEALRAVVALLSLLTLVLIARMMLRAYGERTALLAAILLGTNSLFLSGSLQLDLVGGFLTLFTTLTLVCYLRFLESDERRWLVLTGAGIGLAMLTNLAGFLLVPALVVHYWRTNRKHDDFTYANFIKTFALLGVIAVAFFAVYPLSSLFSGDTTLFRSVGHAFDLVHADAAGLKPAEGTNYALLAIQFLNAFIWIGPLFLCGVLLWILRKKDYITTLFALHALIVFVFFTFVIQDNYRPLEKYFMVLSPGLAVLTTRAVDFCVAKRRHFRALAGAALGMLLLLFALNIIPAQTIPFYPKQAFIEAALTGAWNARVPLLGSSGPIGFYVTLSTIAIPFLLCALLTAGAFAFRKKAFLPVFLLALLGTGLGYSLFLDQQLTLNLAGPDISAVSHEMTDWLRENKPEDYLVFRNVAFEHYLSGIYTVQRAEQGRPAFTRNIDFPAENNAELLKKLDGKTVAVVNFPAINEYSLLWQKLQECGTLKEFSSKGERIGFISQC
jgi:hypothetical protein